MGGLKGFWGMANPLSPLGLLFKSLERGLEWLNVFASVRSMLYNAFFSSAPHGPLCSLAGAKERRREGFVMLLCPLYNYGFKPACVLGA